MGVVRGTRVRLPFLVAAVILLVLCCTQQVVAAAPSGRVRVSVAATSTLVHSGSPVRLRGTISSADRREVVRLQRHTSHGWRDVATDRLNSRRRYSMLVRPRLGTHSYRVVAPAHRRLRWGASAAVRVQALPCTPLARPTSRTAAWFSHPGQRSASQLATNLGRLICSAARGARVDIAMYFIRELQGQADMDALLKPLAGVARYRGVKVNIITEGKVYRSGSPLLPTLSSLRKYTTTTVCRFGCHNDRPDPAAGGNPSIMHHKFVTISDMAWLSRVDPAVVNSSANWSRAQLANQWQSAVVMYDDPVIEKQFDIQWRELKACATDCAGWGAQQRSLGISATDYALTDHAGLWTDAVVHERRGGDGRGTEVVFSPQDGADPLVQELDDFTCTPEHHTVRVAHMFVTRGRNSVIAAFGHLVDRGCDVQVVVTNPGGPLQADGIKRLRAIDVPTTCASRLHDKLILVDAVHRSTGLPDRVLWMGSQSLGGKALRANDESSLRLSTAEATGAAVRENSAVYHAYAKHWQAIDAVKQGCHYEDDSGLS